MIQAEREQIERILSAAQHSISVKFCREGVSSNDEENRSNPRHHYYTFRVRIDVLAGDSDGTGFKRWLELLYSGNTTGDNNKGPVLTTDWKSLAEIADELYVQIAGSYPGRAVEIEVTDNGENSYLVKYPLSRPNLSIKY